jgi:hypothetical protein
MARMHVDIKNKILDALVNQTDWTADTAIWLSLHTADPGDTGASEVSGSSYARVNVTAAFSGAAAGDATNSAQIDFPEVTGSQYVATHWGLWTAVTAGSYRIGGDINPDKTCLVGTVPSFAIGELDLAQD